MSHQAACRSQASTGSVRNSRSGVLGRRPMLSPDGGRIAVRGAVACGWLLALCQVIGGPVGAQDQKPSQAQPDTRPPVVLTDRAREIHARCPVFDGHNDLPWEMRKSADSSFDKADISKPQPQFHTDIERLRRGNVAAQFWSAYVPASTRLRGEAAQSVLEQIALIHRMVKRYPEVFEMASTADDVERIMREGRIASMIGIEGGHAIEGSLQMLGRYYDLGARYMTLTHSATLSWADSATDKAQHGGLSPFGEEVVREMNRLGMLVDISHVSVETMEDALRVSRAPVIASHSSAFELARHPRNIPDRILKRVAENGGLIMINYYSGFVVPESARRRMRRDEVRRELEQRLDDPQAVEKAVQKWMRENPMLPGTIHDVLDHIDHVARVAGVDHVGIGSDFDGVDMLPAQLEDVSTYPLITQGLLDRGYQEDQIRKIMGSNAIRVLRAAEKVAQELKPQQ